MSAAKGDEVRITAGEWAGCRGRVEDITADGKRATVRFPDPKNAAWPFPKRELVAVSDLQRADA